MKARAWIGGYGYRPPTYTKAHPPVPEGPGGTDGLSSIGVGGVIYKTRTRRVSVRSPT